MSWLLWLLLAGVGLVLLSKWLISPIKSPEATDLHVRALALDSALTPGTLRQASDADLFAMALGNSIQDLPFAKLPFFDRLPALHAATNDGSLRQLDLKLRELCPADMWEWPAYIALAERRQENPTRLRMVAALANHILSQYSAFTRLQQLYAPESTRKKLQVRAAGDCRDAPACTALDGKTLAKTNRFWLTEFVEHKKQLGCRCSIRALEE